MGNSCKRFDVAVIGAGFSGSLLAAILAKQGRRVALIDPIPPPRFAIGESSTPLADLLLERIVERWGLSELAPLPRYGSWKRETPGLVCGPKRGFSYFQHRRGLNFEDDDQHSQCMLVTASPSIDVADTHWLRSNVDEFLHKAALRHGADFLHASVGLVEPDSVGWKLRLDPGNATTERSGVSDHIIADFVVDAAGLGPSARTKVWGYEDRRSELLTRSWARYAHFSGVTSWDRQLEITGQSKGDFPFPSDQAAQHHLFDDGWLWMLRFDNGITSVGRVFRDSQPASRVEPDSAFAAQLEVDAYPSVAAMFESAKCVDPPGGLVSTRRLQRWVRPVVGDNFAVLPTAAATIDPLHSTGIAHGMSGVWRIAELLLHQKGEARREQALQQYSKAVTQEVQMLDRLVGGAYLAGNHFEVLTLQSMFYFCAAIATEEAIAEDRWGGVLWLADDDAFCTTLQRSIHSLKKLIPTPNALDMREYRSWVTRSLKPWNHVGLLDQSAKNMYRYTVAPK